MKNTDVERKSLLQKVDELLRGGDWCAFVAPINSGKSTLARQIVSRNGKRHATWRFKYLAVGKFTSLSQIWARINEGEIGVESARQTESTDTSKGHLWFAEKLAEFLTRIPESKFCLVIDDLDSLPDWLFYDFAQELRRFRNEGKFSNIQGKFGCILFGGVRMVYTPSGLISPLIGVVNTLDLPDLSREEMTETLEQQLECTVSGDVIGYAFSLTRGHPHLITILARNLKGPRHAISVGDLEKAATRWIDGCIQKERKLKHFDNDVCFSRSVESIESSRRVFEVVSSLLTKEDERHPLNDHDSALLCGALRIDRNRFVFRGEMLKLALTKYFDELRLADFSCLHGMLSSARRRYQTVRPSSVRKRRKLAVGVAKRRISDLYLSLMSQVSTTRTLPESEELVLWTSKAFIGADHVQLWRISPDKPSPQLILSTRKRKQDQPWLRSEVKRAIINRESRVIEDNRGLLRGISRPRGPEGAWALQLHFKGGIPRHWAREGLDLVGPVLATLLAVGHANDQSRSEQSARFELAHEIAIRTSHATEISDVFNAVMNGLINDLGYESAQISLVDYRDQRIRAIRSDGVFKGIEKLTNRDLLGSDVLAEVIRENEPRVISDCSSSDSHCDPDAIKISGLKSQVIVPLSCKTFDESAATAVGVLQVGSTKKTNAFTPRDKELLRLLADQTATAIQLSREREALRLILDATGDASVVVDSHYRIITCNSAYKLLYGKGIGDVAELTRFSPFPGDQKPLRLDVALGQNDGRLQGQETIKGKPYIVTTAAQGKDVRFIGVEVIGTRNPLTRLNGALTTLLAAAELEQIEEVLTRLLVAQWEFSRAQLYLIDRRFDSLVSVSCVGMEQSVDSRFKQRAYSISLRADGGADGAITSLEHGHPVLVVRESYIRKTDPTFPLEMMTQDHRGRKIVAWPEEKLSLRRELGLLDSNEWFQIPLIKGNQPIGVITVDNGPAGRAFTLEDFSELYLYGRSASHALATALQADWKRQFQRKRETELRSVIQRATNKIEDVLQSWLRLLNCLPPCLSAAAIYKVTDPDSDWKCQVFEESEYAALWKKLLDFITPDRSSQSPAQMEGYVSNLASHEVNQFGKVHKVVQLSCKSSAHIVYILLLVPRALDQSFSSLGDTYEVIESGLDRDIATLERLDASQRAIKRAGTRFANVGAGSVFMAQCRLQLLCNTGNLENESAAQVAESLKDLRDAQTAFERARLLSSSRLHVSDPFAYAETIRDAISRVCEALSVPRIEPRFACDSEEVMLSFSPVRLRYALQDIFLCAHTLTMDGIATIHTTRQESNVLSTEIACGQVKESVAKAIPADAAKNFTKVLIDPDFMLVGPDSRFVAEYAFGMFLAHETIAQLGGGLAFGLTNARNLVARIELPIA